MERSVKKDVAQLRDALLDLVGVLDRPQPDAALIAMAGVDLDRALFPLLMQVRRRGPLGIGELAELCGRDYTTVSRQIAKLDELGLVTRQVNAIDARVKEAAISKRGREMTRALDGAREKLMLAMLADWNADDLATLAHLLRRLADDALCFVRAQKARPNE